MLVQLQRQLQGIPQEVIETETIDRFPALRGEVEMSFTVRFGTTEYHDAILGAVRYGHVWDWSTGRVKDNAFDPLGKLGLLDNHEFPNCSCGSHAECTRQRDYHHSTHETIVAWHNYGKQVGVRHKPNSW